MGLSIYQKSVYLIIFNATMIARSLGKTLKDKSTLAEFKKDVFRAFYALVRLMDEKRLTEDAILESIRALRSKFEFGVSFGQAQKPINVLLKYHFYLTKSGDAETERILHCPVDSVVLRELRMKPQSLAKIDEDEYLKIQDNIGRLCATRIAFDRKWDQENLRGAGITWQEPNL